MPPIPKPTASNRKRPANRSSGAPSSLSGGAKRARKANVVIKQEGGSGGGGGGGVGGGVRIRTPGAQGRPIFAGRTAVGVRAGAASTTASSSSSSSSTTMNHLKNSFIALFSEPQYAKTGISNTQLKEHFGSADYKKLVPIINTLTDESRLSMSKSDGAGSTELYYHLVSESVASKFAGLDAPARMVYQVIERAGNMGIWTKDVRIQTNLQQPQLVKIFKALENRRLIKPVKSVTANTKKLYMLYDLTPSKELTGGVWYSDLEFDHEFINELRTFLLHCVKRLNQGKGVTLQEILEKMAAAKVSRVSLGKDDVQQLINTLQYDYLVEEAPQTTDKGDILYVPARRVTPMCEFQWWDAIAPDFHFREIVFEDGVTLPPHEPHYHSA